MKIFELRRDVDKTGVSGTGVVAQGVIFDNGKCVMTWLSDFPSITVYDSIEDVLDIHGHHGNTKIMQIVDLDMSGEDVFEELEIEHGWK